jgi:hypothetical protein
MFKTTHGVFCFVLAFFCLKPFFLFFFFFFFPIPLFCSFEHFILPYFLYMLFIIIFVLIYHIVKFSDKILMRCFKYHMRVLCNFLLNSNKAISSREHFYALARSKILITRWYQVSFDYVIRNTPSNLTRISKYDF